jgi:thiamine biosynthesis protein ThiS
MSGQSRLKNNKEQFQEPDMTLILKINGVDKEFADDRTPETLSELLDDLGISQATIVAEIDGLIIERRDFDRTPLQPSQTIELVRFVGGG